MRGFGMYAGLALGFVIVANLASGGYAMLPWVRNKVNKMKEKCDDAQGAVTVCKYQENALEISGDMENAECLIPVNHVPETGSFQLVLDNEGIADTQDALLLITNVRSDPEQIYMDVGGKFKPVKLSGFGDDLSQYQYSTDSSSKRVIVGFNQQENKESTRPDFQVYTRPGGKLAQGTIKPQISETGTGKYLELSITKTARLGISCLTVGSSIGWTEVNRDWFWNMESETIERQGPYQLGSKIENKYYRLQLAAGTGQTNPHREEEIGLPEDPAANNAEESNHDRSQIDT